MSQAAHWFLFSTTSSDTLYLVSNSSPTLGQDETNPASALVASWILPAEVQNSSY